MTMIVSQITSPTTVYSNVYSGADQRKHQSSASLAFVWGIHRDRWIPRKKGQLRGKCFHLMTSSWTVRNMGHHTGDKETCTWCHKLNGSWEIGVEFSRNNFKLISLINGLCVSGEIALRWTSMDLNDNKSTLVQVMDWCRQAISRYLNQCWPRSVSPFGVITPQWVNHILSQSQFQIFRLCEGNFSSNSPTHVGGVMFKQSKTRATFNGDSMEIRTGIRSDESE